MEILKKQHFLLSLYVIRVGVYFVLLLNNQYFNSGHFRKSVSDSLLFNIKLSNSCKQSSKSLSYTFFLTWKWKSIKSRKYKFHIFLQEKFRFLLKNNIPAYFPESPVLVKFYNVLRIQVKYTRNMNFSLSSNFRVWNK